MAQPVFKLVQIVPTSVFAALRGSLRTEKNVLEVGFNCYLLYDILNILNVVM